MPLFATLRSLARAPRLAFAVVVTLGLGLAALITTFAIVNAALFRQPPFPEADRLAMLYLERNPQNQPHRRERWSFGRIQLLQESQRSFEGVASYSASALTLAAEGEGDAELLRGEMVSPAYLRLLRVRPEAGRLFADTENDPAAPSAVAIIGHGLWLRRLGGDRAVLGKAVRLNGVPVTVIGILPEEFRGLSGRSELWLPATMAPQLTYAGYVTTNQNFISVVGRLSEGAPLTSAQGELAVLGADINRALPSDPDFPSERVTASAVPINVARVEPSVRRSLMVLLGAVTLLHLLACANVTNLLLGRATARRRESAVRLALGCSSRSLFGGILREGLVLAAGGGGLGLLLAWWAGAAIVPPANVWAPRNFYGSLAPFDAPALSGIELVFGLALLMITALLIALPPALTAFRLDVGSGIKAGSRAIAGGTLTLRRPTARGLIVGIEAALAMLLVVAAGLLIESFQRMRQVNIGVEADRVLTFWVIPSEARVPPEAGPAFVTRLLDAVARVPGVRSATVDGGAPLSGTASSTLRIDGRPAPLPGQAPPVLRHYIGPDHFLTLGIPLRRGRVFSGQDVAGAPRVTVISESAARQFWPDEDPIGKRVWFGGGSNFDSPERSAEIVGIVGDVVYQPLDQQPNFASFYTPYPQFTYASRMVFLKTAGDPTSILPDLRRAITTLDSELAMRDVLPLSELVTGSWARHRFDAMLFGAFGIAAILLAASGIFAVVAYAVAMKTREFGIRIALGANPARVIGEVLREGMAFPTAGLLAGIAASVAVTRVLQSSLYEISPLEPVVFLGTAATLVAVSLLACLGPAWRATRANPIEALRAE